MSSSPGKDGFRYSVYPFLPPFPRSHVLSLSPGVGTALAWHGGGVEFGPRARVLKGHLFFNISGQPQTSNHDDLSRLNVSVTGNRGVPHAYHPIIMYADTFRADER